VDTFFHIRTLILPIVRISPDAWVRFIIWARRPGNDGGPSRLSRLVAVWRTPTSQKRSSSYRPPGRDRPAARYPSWSSDVMRTAPNAARFPNEGSSASWPDGFPTSTCSRPMRPTGGLVPFCDFFDGKLRPPRRRCAAARSMPDARRHSSRACQDSDDKDRKSTTNISKFCTRPHAVTMADARRG